MDDDVDVDSIREDALEKVEKLKDNPPAGQGEQNTLARVATAEALAALASSAATFGTGQNPVKAQLKRTDVPATPDQALWSKIRGSTSRLKFKRYSVFMDAILCGEPLSDEMIDEGFTQADLDTWQKRRKRVGRKLRLPFPDIDAYRQLKVATEVFMMVNCGIKGALKDLDFAAESRRYYRDVDQAAVKDAWQELLEAVDPDGDTDIEMSEAGGTGETHTSDGTSPDPKPKKPIRTIPYLAIIRRKLQDVPIDLEEDKAAAVCYGILMNKLTNPCLLELIWSYWHEEGMLVQTMNAISQRFQNRRIQGGRDPLANFEIDPLRPLNNFLWGYIQDEEHRLTVVRRAYEYDHHYGLKLVGKAVPPVRGADSRARFIEAFHHLLFLCSIFFKEDDDTTVIADGFAVLNGLKEVHLLLTQGAHNQYGDLPWTARQEMLMQEWLLARPEFREFLPRRIMVDYTEEWMDSVETMKSLQGWTDASILHFRDLGVFGEQVLLGVRFGAWPSVIEPEQAANWARYWRPEIQGYIHAYRAVTGADLTERVESTMPSVLLQRRLAGQQKVGAPR
jgi:hypothetical protein